MFIEEHIFLTTLEEQNGSSGTAEPVAYTEKQWFLGQGNYVVRDGGLHHYA